MSYIYEEDDEFSPFAHDSLDKKHIKEIKRHGFPTQIVIWIENEILNVRRRIHSYSPETLSAYALLAHQACNIPYNSDDILSKMGTLKKKKQVFDLISGISSKNSPVHNASICIPKLIKHPNEFIAIVIFNYFNFFYSSMNINLDPIIRDILHFTNFIYDADLRLSNHEPKACASAFVYFYISTFCISFEKTCPVKKTDFKNMKFTHNNEMESINPRNFDDCYKFIMDDFNAFAMVVPYEILQKLICIN